MRYKEIDINIKAIPDKEDEALLNQLMGAKGVSVSDANDQVDQPAADNSDNPGKVPSDDPNTKAQVFPPQQELELKKKEAGKDLAQFDHIYQDSDVEETDQTAREDPPLVQQPQTTTGDQPGVPQEMKNKEQKTESELLRECEILKK